LRRNHEINNGTPPSQSFGGTTKGILDSRLLPDVSFDALWDGIVLDEQKKDRLLSQAVLSFTLRGQFDRASVPLHGILLLVGPPGTGKTSLARGLASKTARSFIGTNFHFLEVEPHALANSSLGKSQQAVSHLLGSVVSEQAAYGPVIVLLDEVETLAADRSKMSLEANPVDVHRATDAVLAQLDQLAVKHPQLLFVATSNFPKAIDSAFLSRVDQIVNVDLPSEEACQLIAADTLSALGAKFHKIRGLLDAREAAGLGKRCHGLDGRQIRKAVLSALTFNKATAANPNLLTIEDVLSAIRDAKHNSTKAS
jgi:SpoVK/Ycf46/Vps4 family AAA+-type ATPase